MKRSKKAVVALQMKRPDEAERLAAGVLRADLSNHIAAKVLGWALLAQGRAGEAIQPVERAARRSNDPEIETVLAVALAATVRQQEALDQLRQTTARRPAFAPAFREYAGQLAKLDRLDEAIEMIKGGIAPVCLACRCKRDEIQRCHANLRGNNSRCSLREIFRGRSITPG